jgi:hypothetical protein
MTPLTLKKLWPFVLFKTFIQKCKILSHAQTILSDKTNYNKINDISHFLLNKMSGQFFFKKSQWRHIFKNGCFTFIRLMNYIFWFFSSCREITDKDLGVIICAVSCTGPCTCPAGWIQILHNSIRDTGSSLSINWQWQIACHGIALCSRWLVYPGDVSVPTIPLGTWAWNTKVYVVV